MAKVSEIASPLHYCAYATDYAENRVLLTEQALSLSDGSLFKQGSFCVDVQTGVQPRFVLIVVFLSNRSCCLAIALVKGVQSTWILQVPAGMFCQSVDQEKPMIQCLRAVRTSTCRKVSH